MLFADFLNWAMELERVSNYKLAKRLDISQTTVANWRTGKTTPYPKMLERVLDLFSTDISGMEKGFPNVHYKEESAVYKDSRLHVETAYDLLTPQNKEKIRIQIVSLLKQQSDS